MPKSGIIGRFLKYPFLSFFNRIRRLHSRLPRKLRVVIGVALGGLTGLIGGVAGLFIGLVLGYLIQELLGQFSNDREVFQYFDNPGVSRFYEGEPGLAAFCALGILINARSSPGQLGGEIAIDETCRKAKLCFPAAASDPAMIEQFCRLAWSQRKNLNSDLLAESLISRRMSVNAAPDDLSHLGAVLYNLASVDKARVFAEEIWQKLDPRFKPAPRREDPWKILDISPQTPLSEIKAHYRMLAAQFHPDVLQALDEEHRDTAARAFIAIQKAYNEIINLNKEES